MRLHDRYLFRELLTPLSYCLGGFLAVWLSFFFFTKLDDMREAKLRAGDVVEFCIASLPEFFLLVLPVLLLLALLYALTHHARHNEITALRAAGVGLWRLCAPYFVVGLLASAVYFALNELAVPRCQTWTAEILTRHTPNGAAQKKIQTRFTKTGYRNAAERRLWQMGEFDAARGTVANANVTWTLRDGSQRQIVAERAEFGAEGWKFHSVQQFIQSSPQGRMLQLATTNVLVLPEFRETPAEMALAIRFSDASGVLASRSADVPLKDLWAYRRLNPQLAGTDGARLLTKFHGRIAAPWTCLIVVLMAIPFGAQSGRRNLFFGVAGSIFICFSYFVLQQVGLALGMSGQVPAWLAAWLPNVVFGVAGIILTSRVR